MTWLDRHLDEQALLRFHYHQLEPGTYQRLVAHLEECVSCRQELDRLEEILSQTPAPDLEFGTGNQEGFWIRMRRRRRRRRLWRGTLALTAILAAVLLLVSRYPAELATLFPGSQKTASVPPVPATEDFDLPLGPGWLQRYLPAPAEPAAKGDTPSN